MDRFEEYKETMEILDFLGYEYITGGDDASFDCDGLGTYTYFLNLESGFTLELVVEADYHGNRFPDFVSLKLVFTEPQMEEIIKEHAEELELLFNFRIDLRNPDAVKRKESLPIIAAALYSDFRLVDMFEENLTGDRSYIFSYNPQDIFLKYRKSVDGNNISLVKKVQTIVWE